MSTSVVQDFASLSSRSQEDLDEITYIQSQFRRSIPMKISYDDICIHEFETGMKTNPRPVFSEIMDFAHETIDKLVAEFFPDSTIKSDGDSWFIKNSFLTMSVCAHCYTNYDCSDFVFEDLAIHRGVISVVAHFNTKYIYGCNDLNRAEFKQAADFYVKLREEVINS